MFVVANFATTKLPPINFHIAVIQWQNLNVTSAFSEIMKRNKHIFGDDEMIFGDDETAHKASNSDEDLFLWKLISFSRKVVLVLLLDSFPAPQIPPAFLQTSG